MHGGARSCSAWARRSRRKGRGRRDRAHSLRLAAHGHFNSDILRSVDALQSEIDVRRVQRVLDTVLAVGATSGADTITGIVSGFAPG